ncbi:BQ2448_5025 [Microbotryum intermedium]|uniref:BQ2448_5025 protein n=1 Tax=Microbotryum intermedium TaxID=269621 RepID=A0A238F6E0_9BASI|nr:BQ2448_5025 [Microbotryum intermedium]
MSDDEATAQSMSAGDGKSLLARSWLEGAVKAVFLGDWLKTAMCS